MIARALVIAIEHYDKAAGGGLEKTLPGTLAAGRAFAAWLNRKWVVERPDTTQVLWCSAPAVPGGRGATSEDIKEALLELQQAGTRATDELYVFFSGHGFSSTNPAQGRADFLVGADFKTPALSAHTCLKLDGIVRWLRDHLGPGRHYYFVDACRNVLDANTIMPTELGLPIGGGAQDEPSTFVLQSTTPGATAAVGSAFPQRLLDGLGGKGTAKAYSDAVPDGMVVSYDSLFGYVQTGLGDQQMVTGEAKGTLRSNAAVLARIEPVPMQRCTVIIDDGDDGETGTIRVKRGRGPVQSFPLTGRTTPIELEPDVYAIAVALDAASVDPDTFVEVTLFDHQPLTFVKGAPMALGAGLGAAAALEIAAPAVRSMRAGDALRPPPAGPSWAGDPVRAGIAAHFPHSADGVEFSESLGGALADPDVDVWLAILAGGRVLLGRGHGYGDYEKIAKVPLRDFSGEAPGASPCYVLAALTPGTPLEIAVAAPTGPVVWTAAMEVPDMPGVFQGYVPCVPGPCLVSLRAPGLASATMAAVAIANRATIVTASWDADHDLQLSQYLVPMGHLIARLAPAVRARVEARQNHLLDVWQLADAARLFRDRRRLAQELPDDVREAMARGEWLDPLGSAFLAYDHLRSGDLAGLAPIVTALQQVAPELPDARALVALAADGRVPATASVPLILDGLRAFAGDTSGLPLPAARLDQRGPWTIWRGAVA